MVGRIYPRLLIIGRVIWMCEKVIVPPAGDLDVSSVPCRWALACPVVGPDHVSKPFKKLAAQAGVPVIKLHESGRHTGNSLMRDAGVDQEVRMREVGHADRSVNDRYTHVLEEAHLAAAEQTASLVREAGKSAP